MTAFYSFVRTFEAFIYIVLAIGGLFAFRWLWRSWQETRIAVYSLEREFASRRLAQSATVSILIVILFCAEFFMVSFILPGLPASDLYPTSTLDLISTPTGTLSAEMLTQFAAAPPVRKPAAGTVGCTPGEIAITSPKPGEEITGAVDLVGSANIPNFGFYKLELAPQGSSTWAIFSAGSKPVKNGSLGRWDTTALTPGDYQLQIVVTDNEGNALPTCIVPVRVMPLQ